MSKMLMLMLIPVTTGFPDIWPEAAKYSLLNPFSSPRPSSSQILV